MSANLAAKVRKFFGALLTAVGESAWVMFSFFAVATALFGPLLVYLPTVSLFAETTIGQLLFGGMIYALVLLLVILPVMVSKKSEYLKRLLGIDKKPTLIVLWLPLLMWFAYMATTIVAALVANYLPWVDGEQSQQIGFENLTEPVHYLIAFVALVVVPPIAEELLFRGYLFGRLRERFSFWFATIVVSITFGIVHLQWNIGIDVAVLSVFLCYLRERTGSIWASMVLHGIKNGLAYFFLFIAPLIDFRLLQ